MDSFEADLQRRVDDAVAANDLAALDSLLQEHYEESDAAKRPFDAAIQLRPQYRGKIDDVGLESNAAFTWANRIARARRRVVYRLKIAGGFSGLRIVSEGDSWWQYPLLLEDVIDQLSGDADKAIYSVCAAGDLIERMAREKEYILALEDSGAGVLLLSGGGNDLLGDGALQKLLVKYSKGKKPVNLLHAAKLKSAIDSILGHYSVILRDLQTRFPNVKVFGHAYDLPYPENGGKWLGGPLKKAGIPVGMRRDVIKVLLDRFSAELKDLQSQFKNFLFVDLRGKVDQGKSSWYDELHPTNSGFARAAQEFRSAIAAEVGAFGVEVLVSPRGVPRVARVATGLAREGGPRFEAARAVIVLDPGHGGSPPPNKIGGSSWNNAVGPNGTLEKTLTLDVARRARDRLQSRGHTVLLTRNGDNNLSLANRAGVAKTNNAPVFASIHFNASTGHNAQGTETFVHTSHNAVSRRLCLTVQASMVAALGLADRNASHPGGVKQAALGVLKPGVHASATACVLHEVSFLDRADEEAKLQSDAYRDRIATALAHGIESYLGTGVELAVPPAEEGEIGDAVELASLEAGDLSVLAPVAAAEEAIGVEYGELSYVGGYALPDEAGVVDLHEERKSEDFIRQLLESEERFRAARTAEETDENSNDRHEFEHVDIGEALDFASLGVSFERDVATLGPVFANVESRGFDLSAFAAFINSLGLEHFSPAEFLMLGGSNAPGGSCSGKNSFPPREFWPRIANTAKMLDEIRRRLGASVQILSCYRSRDYNDCVGGESGSLHMKFNAIDWRCSAGDVHLWHRTAKEVRSANPNFLGGIGLYVSSRFIHIDTRGHAANW